MVTISVWFEMCVVAVTAVVCAAGSGLLFYWIGYMRGYDDAQADQVPVAVIIARRAWAAKNE